MAGLISGAMAPAQKPVSAPVSQGKLKNPTLQKVESEIEAKVAPQSKKMYDSIVVATMKLAFDDKTHPMLIKGLQSTPDIVKNISLICAGMIGTVYQESKQDPVAYIGAAIPASITLMCNLLQFAEDSGMIQVNDDVVAKCTAATTSAVMKKFGIGEDKVKGVVQAAKAKAGANPQGAQQNVASAPQSAGMGV